MKKVFRYFFLQCEKRHLHQTNAVSQNILHHSVWQYLKILDWSRKGVTVCNYYVTICPFSFLLDNDKSLDKVGCIKETTRMKIILIFPPLFLLDNSHKVFLYISQIKKLFIFTFFRTYQTVLYFRPPYFTWKYFFYKNKLLKIIENALHYENKKF